MPSKEVAKVDEASGLPLAPLVGYRALDADPARMKEVIAENIAGGISEFDLDRVKVPSGGGITWEVPTLDGLTTTPDLGGIIIWYRDVRSYWKQSFDEGGGQPPDCSSADAHTGIGDPGGACATCPMSQFGSANKGRGQACTQSRQLFILRQGSVIPILLSAPPTSLKNIRNYMMRLSGNLVHYYGVVTNLTLVKDKNNEGIEYGKIVPHAVSMLPEDQLEVIKDLRRSMMGGLQTLDVEPTQAAGAK
jgi:hypothetical protein